MTNVYVSPVIVTEIMQTTKQVMEQGLAEGNYIDYWQQDDHFECILVSSIKDLCHQVRYHRLPERF